MMVPIAEAAATPEPEMAPNIILAMELVWAYEPGILPTKRRAKFIRRIAIPPWFMILPAKMKKGIAIKVNTEIPVKVRCAPVCNIMLKSRALATGKN